MSALSVSPTAIAIAQRVKDYLRRQFGRGIDCVILYGSHARGTATADSDIDLLVIVDSSLCPTAVRDSIADLLYDLLQEESELVSVMVITKSRFLSERTPFLVNVRREGVVI